MNSFYKILLSPSNNLDIICERIDFKKKILNISNLDDELTVGLLDNNVLNFETNLNFIINKMFRTMYKNGGVGLAANQVGFNFRLFVADCSIVKNEPRFFINPTIIKKNEKLFSLMPESCLSFPGVENKVNRCGKIKIRYQNLSGKYFEENLIGLWAQCYQHETDHLNGIKFVQ